VIASASKVLDTAISVTDAGSRRASAQARLISSCTDTSALGKELVIDEELSGAMRL
jgi:hypothetical protein